MLGMTLAHVGEDGGGKRNAPPGRGPDGALNAVVTLGVPFCLGVPRNAEISPLETGAAAACHASSPNCSGSAVTAR